MFIYKSYIDDYIKCPHYFALRLLNKTDNSDIDTEELAEVFKKSTKSKTYKVTKKSAAKKNIEWLKDTISRVALMEMDTGEKASVYEYRIQYTNKYFKNILNTHTDLDSAALIERLNQTFNLFATHVFLGYNVPIEIPIIKTNVIYRDIIDFMMCDVNDSEKIIIIELDDLSDPIQVRKYYEWPHYKLPYYFLAESLKCDITVIIIDPINTSNKIELLYKPRKFDEVNSLCGKIITDVINPIIFKNLHACNTCDCNKLCFPKEESNVR